MANFSDLVGKTLRHIEGASVGSEEIVFYCEDGSRFRQYHYQDCCESVDLNEIIGDLDDIIGSPILLAEEASYSDEPAPDGSLPEYHDSWTWTFYKLATVKGHLTLRWLGESNGYYSESAYFEQIA